MFRCLLCQKEGRSPPLRKCSQCEIAYYCSKECQKAHWPRHKELADTARRAGGLLAQQ